MTKVVEKKRGALPVYTQLADIIKEDIACGVLAPGNRIPSEAKLADQYDVSPMTARQAITVLVEEGLVKRVHGSGTFVRKMDMGLTTFSMDALNRVLSDKDNLSVEVLKSNIAKVKGIEGEKLLLEKGAPVILVERRIFHKKKISAFRRLICPLIQDLLLWRACWTQQVCRICFSAKKPIPAKKACSDFCRHKWTAGSHSF